MTFTGDTDTETFTRTGCNISIRRDTIHTELHMEDDSKIADVMVFSSDKKQVATIDTHLWEELPVEVRDKFLSTLRKMFG